ncbi:MAG TPA: carboxypeptidase-like regulatory domain-containing protein, partial [Planctomycetota bacterium]|nr:carboxypeptidase-like regulatory domain-containing protein [Planctomycetota bacterium]
MRRSTPILAVCLVLAASLAGWFLLQDRAEGPAPSDEGLAPADPAEEEAATLAARGPAAATVTPSLDGRIRVSVQDAQRKPVGGVRVTVRRLGPAYDPNDPSTWMGGGDANARALRTVAEIDKPPPEAPPDATGTTDDAGACDVEVGRPGSYAVRAEPAAPRWGSSTTVTVTKDQLKPSAALRVGDGTPLRGRVVDARDRPVGAQLRGGWPLPDSQEGWSAPRIATDPATGAFAWEAVPSGEGSIQVTIPGRITISVRVVTPRTEELVIRLSPGGLVRGRVTDPAGAPVEGADVVVSVAALKGSEAVERGAVARAKTGADGTYRMEEVPPGQVGYVSTVAEGYRARTDLAAQAKWAPAEVAAGQETVLDVVLDRGSVIEGRVLTEGTGAPVPNAQVHALVTQSRWNDRPPPVMTDVQGRFRFEGLAVGRYVLAATSATHYFDPFAAGAAMNFAGDGTAQLQDAIVAVIGKDGERLERDIRMKSGLSVRGRVVAPDGTALEGAKVSCPQIQPWNAFWRWGVAQPGMIGSEATTAADGTFRLTGLPPGEAVTLSARKSPWTGPPSTPFKLAVGEPEPEIVLKMEPGCTVTGRVLDAQGEPVAGAQIQWWAQDQVRQGNGQGVSEPDGTFRLEGLPPPVGQVNSWASGKNASAEVSPALTTGEVRSGVDLRFVSGATISGVVVDAEGHPLKGIRLAASPVDGRGNFGMSVSREDGTFEMTNVAEMEYRVGVNPAPDEHSVAAPTEGPTVRAPATGVRIVAKARLETLVAGRVLLPDGTPVPLCSVRIGRGEQSGTGVPSGSSTRPATSVSRRAFATMRTPVAGARTIGPSVGA